MALDYRPLWNQLVDKEMNMAQIMKAAGITSNAEDVVRIVPNKYENEATQENE